MAYPRLDLKTLKQWAAQPQAVYKVMPRDVETHVQEDYRYKVRGTSGKHDGEEAGEAILNKCEYPDTS